MHRLKCSFVVSGSQDCTIKMWRVGRSLAEVEEMDDGKDREIKKLKVKFTQLAHDKVIEWNSFRVSLCTCSIYHNRTLIPWMFLQMTSSSSPDLRIKLQRCVCVDVCKCRLYNWKLSRETFSRFSSHPQSLQYKYIGIHATPMHDWVEAAREEFYPRNFYMVSICEVLLWKCTTVWLSLFGCELHMVRTCTPLHSAMASQWWSVAGNV